MSTESLSDGPRQSKSLPDEPPAEAAACSRCGERFPTERLRDLHRGLDHYEHLDPAEVEAYEDAYRDETDDLRIFRLEALGALVALYFVFLFAYSIFA